MIFFNFSNRNDFFKVFFLFFRLNTVSFSLFFPVASVYFSGYFRFLPVLSVFLFFCIYCWAFPALENLWERGMTVLAGNFLGKGKEDWPNHMD